MMTCRIFSCECFLYKINCQKVILSVFLATVKVVFIYFRRPIIAFSLYFPLLQRIYFIHELLVWRNYIYDVVKQMLCWNVLLIKRKHNSLEIATKQDGGKILPFSSIELDVVFGRRRMRKEMIWKFLFCWKTYLTNTMATFFLGNVLFL